MSDLITEKKIGVLMGGTSAEREVSLKSGTAVFDALQQKGYRVVAIDVGHDICQVLQREGIEIAFLVMHGGHGENGAIQGLLEVMGVPYTGSGVLASALAMDKESAKKVFMHHQIPVPPFVVISNRFPGQGNRLGTGDSGRLSIPFVLPWVVKPATEGSSIGVSIVREEASLAQALDQALKFGGRVVIEKYIPGREIQVGILNGAVLGAVEIRPKIEFYSYEAKYTPGLTEYILPPDMDIGLLGKAEDTALSAHRVLGCNGATRVDLVVDQDGIPYVLEVNTIPGMTETSLLPKIARLAGLGFPDLVEAILRETLTIGRTR